MVNQTPGWPARRKVRLLEPCPPTPSRVLSAVIAPGPSSLLGLADSKSVETLRACCQQYALAPPSGVPRPTKTCVSSQPFSSDLIERFRYPSLGSLPITGDDAQA